MGTQWSIEKVDKTESDLGVDYKGETNPLLVN